MNEQTNTLEALACPACHDDCASALSGCQVCGWCPHTQVEGGICTQCGEIVEHGSPVG